MTKRLPWILASLMVGVMLLFATVTTPHLIAADVLRGDANGDTEVDMGDVVKQERCIVEWDSDCAPGADADADGDVDMGDVIATIRIIAGLPIIISGDANGDGLVSMGDVVLIDRCILGLSTCSPGADANADGELNMGDIVYTEVLIMELP